MSWIDNPQIFPNIHGKYREKSQRDGKYNCIAWAANDTARWWSHSTGYVWPAPRRADPEALVSVFESLGYSRCGSGALEPGVEKVALYAISRTWSHAARQLANGEWTSKLGEDEDIQHETAECLEGPAYGTVYCFMKRTTS
ncbi:MAG: hypothetical protein AB1716_16570 [Planctomycetota bacterium]